MLLFVFGILDRLYNDFGIERLYFAVVCGAMVGSYKLAKSLDLSLHISDISVYSYTATLYNSHLISQFRKYKI